MAVQFNGSQCCPTNGSPKKAQFGQKAKFGHAPQAANFSQRAGAPGQVQFGIVDGGVVSGPCSCVACCCAPFLAIPVGILAWVLGKRVFRGIGGAGRGIGRSISGLTDRFSKGAKQAAANVE